MDAKEAIKYLKSMLFPSDMSESTLKAIAVNKMAISALEKAETLEAENARLEESSDKWTDLMNKAGAVGLTEADFFKMVEPIKIDKE